MAKKPHKIIVTGGAGFMDSHIVDALVSEGHKVHIIDNLSGGKKENVNRKAVLHVADVTDLESIQPIFEDADYVFHLAAIPSVQYSIEHPVEANKANVDGTVNTLIAAQKAGVKKVIYSASAAAYGDQEKMPLSESMKASPKSPYGLQKYLGELYMRTWHDVYGLDTVSLRYFNAYGPRSKSEGAYATVISRFMEQRRRGETITITGDGKQTRDFVSVHDIVRANIMAMKSDKVGKGEVINIGSGKKTSVGQIARLIGGPRKYIPARLEPRHSVADITLAKKLLGWKPEVSLEDGLQELDKVR